jgi:pimeloyl-ACP methyl ester carboxylesterase
MILATADRIADYRACGRQDQVCPLIRMEELNRLLPDAAVQWFGDCGHLAPLERSGEVAAALNMWLARSDARESRL